MATEDSVDSPAAFNLAEFAASKEEDKKEKSSLVVNLLTDAILSGGHPIIVDAFPSFKTDGDTSNLRVDILSGGLTNYSYRIFIGCGEKYQPGDDVIYGKLAFSYALWSPTKEHYTTERVDNEFTAMKMFADVDSSKSKVAKPIAVFSSSMEEAKGGDMKLLITEYCASYDEQIANQFIEGLVDDRTARAIGIAFADLNCNATAPAPDFNLHSTISFKGVFDNVIKFIESTMQDRSIKTHFKKMLLSGDYEGAKLVRSAEDMYGQRDCICHNDSHVFNILCEAKPEVAMLQNFGPEGGVKIVDWEMSHMGPFGRDIGQLWSFPLANALNHYRLQQTNDSDHIMKWIRVSWSSYAEQVEKNMCMSSVDYDVSDRLKRTLIEAIGWAGCFGMFMHSMNFHLDTLSEQDSVKAADQVRDSFGCLCLKLLNLAFEPKSRAELNDSSIDVILSKFAKTVDSERLSLLVRPRVIRRSTRRSSVLRESGRRVSDSSFWAITKEHAYAEEV